ncbi:heterokaryon incompatibility protein-domain-containing protein, partial [Lophiotrema nucula]
MRLLASDTLEFCADRDPNNTKYAILSHTWGSDEEEVNHQAMCNPTGEIRERPGYKKLVKFAEIAQGLGHPYIWIDTCCIDKSSSAELTEAINSMYHWYQASQVCIVYLADCVIQKDEPAAERKAIFRKARWFTRGWTLQELLAPKNIRYYSSSWDLVSIDISLMMEMTHIPERVLRSNNYAQDVSVAQKMSWASHRRTKRPEDMAYCLMGTFGVNMPLLYGEGEKAFIRLQEEIIRRSNDYTIFLW